MDIGLTLVLRPACGVGMLDLVSHGAERPAVPAPNRDDLAAATWSGTRRQALRIGGGIAGVALAGCVRLNEDFWKRKSVSGRASGGQAVSAVQFAVASNDELNSDIPLAYAFPAEIALTSHDYQVLDGVDGVHQYLTFAQQRGGVRLWGSRLRLTVQTADHPVTLTNIAVNLSRTGPPVSGTLMWPMPGSPYVPAAAALSGTRYENVAATIPFAPPYGEATVIRLKADLDRGVVSSYGEAAAFFADRTVQIKPSEVVAFDLAAWTTHSYFNGMWSVRYVLDGRSYEKVLTQSGFKVTAAMGRVAVGESPDFKGYDKLYVAEGKYDGKVVWSAKDPRSYRG